MVDLNWPFAPKDVETADIKAALKRANLEAIAITPEIYNKDFVKGGFTNPDPKVRAQAIDLVSRAAELATELGCDYVKLWPGQDGVDYPFQANSQRTVEVVGRGCARTRDHLSRHEVRDRVQATRAPQPDVLLVGRVHTAGHRGDRLRQRRYPAGLRPLALRRGVPGRGRSADHARGRLFAIDVNDNYRGWDDDMVVGSVHLLETFEFFQALHEANWQGVWQLDQFPFREDPVQAARDGVATMRGFHRALELLDHDALRAAQSAQDALLAQRIAKRALYRALAEGLDLDDAH